MKKQETARQQKINTSCNKKLQPSSTSSREGSVKNLLVSVTKVQGYFRFIHMQKFT